MYKNQKDAGHDHAKVCKFSRADQKKKKGSAEKLPEGLEWTGLHSLPETWEGNNTCADTRKLPARIMCVKNSKEY